MSFNVTSIVGIARLYSKWKQTYGMSRRRSVIKSPCFQSLFAVFDWRQHVSMIVSCGFFHVVMFHRARLMGFAGVVRVPLRTESLNVVHYLVSLLCRWIIGCGSFFSPSLIFVCSRWNQMGLRLCARHVASGDLHATTSAGAGPIGPLALVGPPTEDNPGKWKNWCCEENGKNRWNLHMLHIRGLQEVEDGIRLPRFYFLQLNVIEVVISPSNS